MRLLPSLAVTLALLAGTGCAADTEETEDDGSALRQSSVERIAGAFTVDYGLGALAGRHIVDIPRDDLMTKLPDGDARRHAQCLETRDDVVRGETLTGGTWTFEGKRHYVLVTELRDGNGLRDLHMLFVYGSDGAAEFQVLAWDGRKNLKVSYRGLDC